MFRFKIDTVSEHTIIVNAVLIHLQVLIQFFVETKLFGFTQLKSEFFLETFFDGI